MSILTQLVPTTLSGFGQAVTDLIAGATDRADAVVLSSDGTKVTISRRTAHGILAARAAEAVAKKAKEDLEKQLKAEIGQDATEILVEGQVVFSWVPQTKTVLDTARLKAERPEVFAEFAKTQVTRPLLARPKIVTALFG